MTRRILVLQGHPDAAAPHLCHALAAAYVQGAREAGHEVRELDIATLDFPLLRDPGDWTQAHLPPTLQAAQQHIQWADHLVLVFPLWLGDMPALVKAFLEQVMRPGFGVQRNEGELQGRKLLGGRSARIIVTMGMPAALYRWYFRAQALSLLERNIFGFVGIAPVRRTLVGGAGRMAAPQVARWQARLHRLGGQGA